MSEEQENILQDMDATRDSLTEKIGLLEQKVVDTAQDATAGVKETVEAVKEAVQESVQSVKETVGDTVGSVKQTFDLNHQVDQRPWTIVAGGVGLGFLVGYLLNPPTSSPEPRARAKSEPRRSSSTGNGHGSKREPFADEIRPARSAVSEKGVFEQLTTTFEKEIDQIKGLAIGTLVGIVRDMVVSSVPEKIKTPIHEVCNSVTTRLGGQPIHGQILPDDWKAAWTSAETETDFSNAGPPRRQTSFS